MGPFCSEARNAGDIQEILAWAPEKHASLRLGHNSEDRAHQFHLRSRKEAKALQGMGCMPKPLEQGLESDHGSSGLAFFPAPSLLVSPTQTRMF